MAVSQQQYITETKNFFVTGQTDSNCNTILFVNTGVSDVSVDGFTLTPNQSLSILGNRGEINVKTYQFTFADTTKVCKLTAIFKRYV